MARKSASRTPTCCLACCGRVEFCYRDQKTTSWSTKSISSHRYEIDLGLDYCPGRSLQPDIVFQRTVSLSFVLGSRQVFGHVQCSKCSELSLPPISGTRTMVTERG